MVSGGCLGVSGECLGASGGVWVVLDGVWMVLKALFSIWALCAPPRDIQESWTPGLIGVTIKGFWFFFGLKLCRSSYLNYLSLSHHASNFVL